MSIWSTVSAIFTPITALIESFNGSRVELEKIKYALDKVQCAVFSEILELEKSAIEAHKAISLADAAGKSWLQRCCRPIISLSLIGLVISDQFGFLPSHLSPQAWVLVNIVVGAHFTGRSVEKISSPIAHAISKRKDN